MPYLPAARIADPISDMATQLTPGPPTGVLAPPGVPTVLIGGKPAAVVGGFGECAVHFELGPANLILPGIRTSGIVLIGGRPAARQGDMMACNAKITLGALNVLIGG